MKRLNILFTTLLVSLMATAQTNASAILQKAVSTFNADDGISATIKITMGNKVSSGTIYMSGALYTLSFSDVKVWYNGKTMWCYMKENQEVSITEPTLDELLISSPAAIIQSAHMHYNVSMLKSAASTYALRLTPKEDNDVREIILSIMRNTYRIESIKLITIDGSVIKTDISNYKAKNRFPKSTFVFDKKAVPQNTFINDLR